MQPAILCNSPSDEDWCALASLSVSEDSYCAGQELAVIALEVGRCMLRSIARSKSASLTREWYLETLIFV